MGDIRLLTVYDAYQVERGLFAEAPLPVNVGIAVVAVGSLLLLAIFYGKDLPSAVTNVLGTNDHDYCNY